MGAMDVKEETGSLHSEHLLCCCCSPSNQDGAAPAGCSRSASFDGAICLGTGSGRGAKVAVKTDQHNMGATWIICETLEKIFHCREIRLRTEGEAEGSREARAVECGSKGTTGAMPGETARRWVRDSQCFGWKHSAQSAARGPRRRCQCSASARLEMGEVEGSHSELR